MRKSFYVKEILVGTLITSLLFCTQSFAISPVNPPIDQNVNVWVEGEYVEFPDAQPFIDESGRTLVPVRFVSEQLGATVTWNEKERMVDISKDEISINLSVGKSIINKLINAVKSIFRMDTKPILKENRVFVPLRFVSESFGTQVYWVAETRSVFITKDPKVRGYEGDLFDKILVSGQFKQEYKETNDYLLPRDENAKFTLQRAGYYQLDETYAKTSDVTIITEHPDLYTRHKIKEIFMMAYPDGYEEAYGYLMKTLRDEINLNDGVFYNQSGVNKVYFNGRELSVYKTAFSKVVINIGTYGAKEPNRAWVNKLMHYNWHPALNIDRLIEMYDLDQY